MVAYFDNLNWCEQSPYEYTYPESQTPSLFYNHNNNNNQSITCANKSENYSFYKNSNDFHQSFDNSGFYENVHRFQPCGSPASGQPPLHQYQPPVAVPIPPVRPSHMEPMIPNHQSYLPHSGFDSFAACGTDRESNRYYSDINPQSFGPCKGQQSWDYAQCYGYYGEEPCQYINVIDIEDFMSNEKRKEKSRDAARCRRSRETEIFTELGQVLPLQREEVEQLDKASIMRLSIAYLKVREMLNLFPNIDDIQEPPPLLSSDDDRIEELEMKPFDILNGPESYKYLTSALDGFLLILSGDGDVTFVSESIAEYLGISQIDLLGQQIWEYTHQCDHDELKEALNIRRGGNLIDDKGKENGSNASNVDGNDNKNGSNESNNVLTTAHRDLFLRLKCTLTSRGRSVNIKSASYKVIHLTGHMVANTTGERILIGVGRPLPHPSNIEIPLGSATFLTKHSLDMKFTYVDDKMLSLLGYEPEDLLGKSLYECHHGADSESLMTTFKSVLSKGQGETCRYRFLGKTGGYCWVVSQATIVYDKQKPQSVVCVNYAVSELENNNEIYSCAQLEASCKNKEIEKDESTEKNLQDVQQQKHHQPQSKYYPPQKLQNAINTQIKTCAGDVRLNAVKILCKQQTVENPQIVVKCSDTAGSYTKNVLPPQVIRNSGASILFKKQAEESSVSPVRRTLNACSISSSNLKTPTGLEKRPKSVTASVFTQVPINSELIATFNQQSLPSNNSANLASSSSVLASQQQLPNQSQPPAAPTKSVTASVLTPISALTSPISRSFLPNTFGKGLSRNPANSASNKNNNSSSTPRDMNSRYLMFSEESPELTMLKEEPDDLTHLAPSLDDSTQLFGEMLDSLILPDAYGTLLSDDINSLDSQQSNCNNSSKNNNNNNNHHIDPFINYRDESNDTSCSPHLLSPGSASKSPEMSSIPSLCSPNSLSQDDEFAFMTMNVEDDIDLTMRAPYIPMNEQEDLPLLTEDLMWSAFSEELSLHKEALQMESLKNNSNNAVSSNCNTLHTSSISNSGINNNNNNSNEHSNSHKNNISTAQDNSNNLNDNESSLAALLCGNGGVNALHQHQHQSHQSHEDNNSDSRNISSISEVNILENDCKRRKILSVRNDNFGSDLMDSIDDFGPVFNKNSSNVDCWTMNHLLELNDSNPSSPTTSLHHHNQQQNPEKQSIIINTAIPTTTIHVPLITIQNKNTNSKLNCHSILNSNAIVTSNSNNNTTVNNSTITNSSCNNNANSMRRLSATLVKGINVNISPNANNCNSSGKPIAMNIGAIINQQNNNNSSKRPSNIILTATESKRLRNSPVVDAPTSPQLLQQLMAPSPQRPASRSPYERVSNSGGTRWTNNIDGGGSCNGGNGRNNTNNSSNGSSSSQAQPSNSVLKNLLVSGCDDTFPLQTPDEETCLSRSLQSPPLPGFYGSPLMCNITAEHILCRRATNPLIGGESILPSPPIPMDSDADMDEGGDSARHALHINLGSVDSLVGSVFSPVGSESSCSDSGIECGATINRGSSIIAGLFRSKNQSDNSKGAPLPGALKMAPAAPPPKEKLLESNQDANGADDLDGEGTRKMSFSFLDDENPLCSPFLMDLCDDVYNMDEPLHSEYMEGSEMTRVLSDWSPTGTST